MFRNCMNDGSWPAVHAYTAGVYKPPQGALFKRQGIERWGQKVL